MTKKLAKQWRLVLGVVAVLAFIVVVRNTDTEASGSPDLPADACQAEITADVLNVRSGPGVENASVEKLSQGAVVAATGESQNGFRRIGDARWVSEEFVRVSGNC